jgi:hypothetical protein
MAYDPMSTAGNLGDPTDIGKAPRVLGARLKLFTQKNPGAFGKLGKNPSTKSESLSKLRGKGALA